MVCLQIYHVYFKEWTIFTKWSTNTKMKSYELEGGRLMMKSMEIENHDNARISCGWRYSWKQWQRLFVWAQTSQIPTNSFTYFQSCGH
jgi:hypothetical protein